MQNWKRQAVLFLSSQGVSMFGSSIVQYAIMWHLTLTTQSGLMMTFYIICGFLPTFFLSPFAGVWADRYDRKKLIIGADGGIAIATLILAILFLSGIQHIWLLFIVVTIRAIGAGIQTPAVGAVLPQIVPEEKLMRVNGINGTIQSMIFFGAPLISAALLSITTLEMILFVDVVTALIAIVIMFFLKLKHVKNETASSGYLADFTAGLRYVKSSAYLKWFFIYFSILFFLMAPASFLTPLQVTRTFGGDVWRLTAIELTFSVGMMIGGAVIAAWQGFNNRVHTMVLGGLAFGLCTMLFGLVPNFMIYLAIMGICGIAMPIFNTPTMTMLQENIDPAYIGRVFGLFSMISSSMMPMGMVLFGPLADVIDIEWILIFTGVIMMILSVAMLKTKALVRAGVKNIDSAM